MRGRQPVPHAPPARSLRYGEESTASTAPADASRAGKRRCLALSCGNSMCWCHNPPAAGGAGLLAGGRPAHPGGSGRGHRFLVLRKPELFPPWCPAPCGCHCGGRGMPLGSVTWPSCRFLTSCASQRLVVVSSFSTWAKVVSFSWSGRHCLRASRALGLSERRR